MEGKLRTAATIERFHNVSYYSVAVHKLICQVTDEHIAVCGTHFAARIHVLHVVHTARPFLHNNGERSAYVFQLAKKLLRNIPTKRKFEILIRLIVHIFLHARKKNEMFGESVGEGGKKKTVFGFDFFCFLSDCRSQLRQSRLSVNLFMPALGRGDITNVMPTGVSAAAGGANSAKSNT